MPRLRYAILALAVLASAACSDDGDGEAAATSSTADDPTTTTSATATTPSTTPSTTTATTVAPPGPPPELIQTGDDLAAIVQSLHAYEQWLSTNPDPALLGRVSAPGNPAYDSLIGRITELRDLGYRWDRPQERLSEIVAEPQPVPVIGTVRALATPDPAAPPSRRERERRPHLRRRT